METGLVVGAVPPFAEEAMQNIYLNYMRRNV